MSKTRRVCLAILFTTLIGACTRAPVAQTQTQPAAAMVNGQPLYDEDIAPFIKSELEQLKRQEYNLKIGALDRAIEQKLLSQEAERRKVSVEEMLRAEVDAKVTDPTDQEIQSYYEAQKQSFAVPLEQIRPQIVELLKGVRLNQARQSFAGRLRQKAAINVLLKAPRVEVAADTKRMKGNPNATVTIVEFSDYQCPYCKQAEPIVVKLMEEYGDKVRFSYRDVPLASIHPRAQPAAEAAQCAAEQNKFWPYHDLLIQPTASLEDEALLQYAKTAGLDERRFKSCVDGGKYRQQVQADYQDGIRAGVNGTPTFFINGVAVSGAQPLETLRQIVDRELQTAATESKSN